jgi:hypothetical protein
MVLVIGTKEWVLKNVDYCLLVDSVPVSTDSM